MLTILILAIKKGLKESSKILKYHILEELPKMKSEITLFLVAGFFGIIISSVLLGLDFKLPFIIFE